MSDSTFCSNMKRKFSFCTKYRNDVYKIYNIAWCYFFKMLLLKKKQHSFNDTHFVLLKNYPAKCANNKTQKRKNNIKHRFVYLLVFFYSWFVTLIGWIQMKTLKFGKYFTGWLKNQHNIRAFVLEFFSIWLTKRWCKGRSNRKRKW
jgi:hypothetical protein